jgi:hypothetical protein
MAQDLNVQWPFRFHALNSIGGILNKTGLWRVPLTVEGLEAAACRQTGLSDFGDEDYRSGLAAYVDSLHRDKSFHFVGKLVTSQLIIQRLRARLKTVETLKHHPELVQGKLDRPLLVMGSVRSGTTLLYNLLALDPTSRSPEFWEVADPCPPASLLNEEQKNKRIQGIQRGEIAAYNKLMPHHKQIHHFADARQTEECFHLIEPTFRFCSFALLYGDAPTYRDWLDGLPESEMIRSYRYYEQMVKLLMHGHDGKRWLGKSPGHTQHLPALAEVIPNAMVVHTHRDPRQRIPSLSSLLYHYQCLFLDPAPLPADVGKLALEWDRRSMEGMRLGRSGPTGNSTFDVEYENLVRDPIGTVASIYDFFGLELSSTYENSMHDWLRTKDNWNPKKVGRHNYTAASFGLTDSQLSRLEP